MRIERKDVPPQFRKALERLHEGYMHFAGDPARLAKIIYSGLRKEPVRSEALNFMKWLFSQERSDRELFDVWTSAETLVFPSDVVLRDVFVILDRLLREGD